MKVSAVLKVDLARARGAMLLFLLTTCLEDRILQKWLKIAASLLVPLIILASLVGCNGAFEGSRSASTTPVRNTDPYLQLPVPDPDSDVLFAGNNAEISLVRANR
jgi:hypothetical protein